MNVLVPMPYDLSRLDHGRNLRIAHLLNGLCGTCRVTMVCRGRDADAARRAIPAARIEVADIAGTNASLAAGIERRVPRVVRYFGCDADLMSTAADLAGDFDAVLGFDLPVLSCLLAVDAIATDRHPIAKPALIADLIDDPLLTHRSSGWRERWSHEGIKTLAMVRVIRRRVLPRMDALIAVAPRDAETLANACGRPVKVIPNGVEALPSWNSAARDEPLVVFTGAMSFPPNAAAARWMVRRVWPRVLRELSFSDRPLPVLPTLALVGADPSPAVRALQSDSSEGRILVTGRVEDLRAWQSRARLAVAPMVSGSGMKNKVLEACAAGCPVIATPLGAAGLPQGEAAGILVASSADSFAGEVANLLFDAVRAARLGAAARTMVQTQFSWRRSAQLLHDAIAAARPRATGVACTLSAQPAREEVACHAAS